MMVVKIKPPNAISIQSNKNAPPNPNNPKLPTASMTTIDCTKEIVAINNHFEKYHLVLDIFATRFLRS
jgi:hypothetical protein